ncbi:MAG: flavodoxin family protein [Phycisphaerales bacterium]
MKSLIVCVSISNGSTRRVADQMAEVLGAEVAEPEAVDVDTLGQYDLVGFGSGIYFMAAHPRLRRFVRDLPRVDGLAAFTFFTSGLAERPLLGIRRGLASKGIDAVDSFSCRGLDTMGPFKVIGGLNKGRPDDHDLEQAAAFAARLRGRVAGT